MALLVLFVAHYHASTMFTDNLALVRALRQYGPPEASMMVACNGEYPKTSSVGLGENQTKAPSRSEWLVALLNGDCEDVIPLLDGLLATDSEDTYARYWLGVTYRSLGLRDKARELWMGRWGAWPFYVGRTYLNQGNASEAEWWLSLAAYSGSNSAARSYESLAGILMNEGRKREALSLLDDVLTGVDRDTAVYWYFVGLRSELNGDLNEAAVLYAQGALAFPGDQDLHMQVKDAYERLGRVQEALAHAEDLMRLRPDYWRWRYEAARLAYQAGQLDLADAYGQSALPDSPNKYTVETLLLRIACAREDLLDAERHYLAGISDPNAAYTPYQAYSECLQSRGYTAAAIEILRAGENRLPTAWPLVLMLGTYCDQSNDKTCAFIAYQKLLRGDASETMKQVARVRLSAIGEQR